MLISLTKIRVFIFNCQVIIGEFYFISHFTPKLA